MVIHDFNVVSVALIEAETHAPLLVNANTPLFLPIPCQLFQPIGWRYPQILQTGGIVQLQQPHSRPLQDVRPYLAGTSSLKEMRGFGVTECLDHGLNRKLFV